jgi:CHAT domain-containing protein/Tfp pilus assembly protein PilF
MWARRSVPLFALVQLAALCLALPASGADPVGAFIGAADSAAGAPGDGALARCVSANIMLVGAAVGQLVETGLELREAGREDDANANLGLAGRLARLYRDETGSSAPLDYVTTCAAWRAEQLEARRQAKALERESAQARGRGEIDRAIDLLGRAQGIYQSIGDTRAVAVLWGSLGVACWQKGDFEAVARHYERALEARRAIEDRILEGKTLNGLGSVNYELGNLDAALGYYRQAISLRQKTGDSEGLATSLTYLGNAYLAMGRMVEARTAFEQALPAVESAGNAMQQYELLTSIASLNAEMGRLASSNAALEQALALARDADDPRQQAICHTNLALNYAQAYRYGDALAELDASRGLLQRQPDPEQYLIYYRNRGITHLRIGELDWARADFDTLYTLSESHKMPVSQLEALVNLGYLSIETGDLEDGLSYAEQAGALAREIQNPRMLRESLILAAEIERHLSQYENALEKWEAALDLDRQAGAESDVAADWLGAASIHALAGRSDEARRIYRDVAPAIEASGDGDLMLAWKFGMGHTYERTDSDSARYFYEQGLDRLDRTRAEVGAAEVRTGYLGGLRRTYFEEVATYYASLAAGQDAETWSARAFRTVERAKARGLLELMEASLLAQGSPEEEALLDSLYRLDPGSPDFAASQRTLKESYAAVRRGRLDTSAPRWAAGEALADPEALRTELPKGAALLSYALGDTASLVWAIDRDGCEVFRLPRRAEIEREVERLRDAIAHPVVADEALRLSAHSLFQAVVAPAWGRIGRAKQLIVAPDGALFEVPFEVLLTAEPMPGAAWKDLPYLARSHLMTYVPSASVYVALRQSRQKAKYEVDLLAMGDPDYSLLPPDPRLRGPVEPLPHTRDEVRSIASKLASKNQEILVGAEANEAALKTFVRSHSVRVVHLAAHGFVNQVEPTASSVALCPDPERTEDGYLHTLEVMSLPMRVGLVVLSACESARGQIGRGEGVVGLSRAFLASGASGIVASLWPVSDQSTALLMGEFYDRMLVGKKPASRALNEARFALMGNDRYAHPYYWSPFVVTGLETSPW